MAAPTNDLFANALLLPSAISGGDGGTTFDAVVEAAEPAAIGSNDQSVWFVWTCPATGWYKWTIPQAGHVYRGVFGPSDQSKIGILIYPDGTLTQMSNANALSYCYGDLNPLAAVQDLVLAAFLTSGQKYYIKAVTARSGTTLNAYVCDFLLNWEKFTPPANDDFANRIALGTLPATIDGTTLNATFQAGSESMDQTGPTTYDKEQSVWYTFTVPTTGRYRLKLANPGTNTLPVGHTTLVNQNLWLQLSTGTTLANFEAGEVYNTNINWSSWQNRPEIPFYVDLVGSTTYILRLYCPYHSKQMATAVFNKWAYNFRLVVEAISKPANDDFANAQVMSTSLPNTATGNTRDSTEEAGEPSLPYTFEQSVWFKFTPVATGKYRFRIQEGNIATTGHILENGELVFSLKQATTVADHTSANTGGYIGPVHDASSWLNKMNIANIYDLVSGIQYNIKVNSPGGGTFENFNNGAASFTMDYQAIAAPSNDNFANAQSISGASGNVNFTCLGATSEHASGELPSFYWNGDPGNDVGPSVWFTWTAPSTGFFKFHVESNQLMQGGYDISVYTGSALNALTRVNSTWAGDKPNAIADRSMTNTLGISAVSGTVYKIQIVGWGHMGADTAKLTWSTLTTPVGDSAAAPVAGLFTGRADNWGHTDNDLPPNFVALASAHDYWWYNDGKAGKTKWYCYTATQDSRIQISAQQWIDDDPFRQSNVWMDDWGIIAYKGASYATLAVAQAYNEFKNTPGLENVVMFPNGGTTWDGVNYNDYLTTHGDGSSGHANPVPVVDVAAGEKLWICVFGAYDNDINGDASNPGSPIFASEVSFDLVFNHVKPPNDDIESIVSGSVYGYPDYLYDLRQNEYWGGIVFGNRFAGTKKGTTFGATTQAGELAHGGYGPTRSVWYSGGVPLAGQWKYWVEAPEDCVLSIYTFQDTANPAILVSRGEDDDSGAGNWPQIILTTTGPESFWVCIDSKVATNFQLKWERVNQAAVIPANDLFANAVDLNASPKVLRGTTVGASAEYFEIASPYDDVGPTDSVWYKWVSDRTGIFRMNGRVLSNNFDGWVMIDCFTGPDKDHLTYLGNGAYGGIFYGPIFLNGQNDVVQLPVNLGQTYYFRVMTEEGGSEEFELWVDTDVIYLNLIPGGTEDQPRVDFGNIRLKLTPSGSDVQKNPTADAGTVYLDLQPISTFEDLQNSEFAEIPLKLTVSGTDVNDYNPVDAATINLKLTPSGEEDHTHLCFAGEGNPELRWYGDPYLRWEEDPLTPDLRWFSHLHKGAQYC